MLIYLAAFSGDQCIHLTVNIIDSSQFCGLYPISAFAEDEVTERFEVLVYFMIEQGKIMFTVIKVGS